MDIHYACVKLKLSKILKSQIDYTPLYNAINDTNNIMHLSHLFIRGFLIYSFENNIIFDINIEFFRAVVKFLYNSSSKGRKSKEINIIDKIKAYWNIFSKDIDINKATENNKYNATCISSILDKSIESMYIAVINNLNMHLYKHIQRYIICLYEKYTNKKYKKELELSKVIPLILSGNRNFIEDKNIIKFLPELKNYVPTEINSKLGLDANIKLTLYKFLKLSYYLNKTLEDNNKKNFQFFPLKRSSYNTHITIETGALVDLFYNSYKQFYPNLSKTEAVNCTSNQIIKDSWNKLFNFKHYNNTYKQKKYQFNNCISTNGYSVSIGQIHKNDFYKQQKKIKSMAEGRTKSFKSDLDEDTKKANKIKKMEDDREKNKKRNELKRELDKNKTIEQKLKEEYDSIIENNNKIYDLEKIIKYVDFKEKLKKQYEDGKILFIDPGKRSLLYGICYQPSITDISINNKYNLQTNKNKTNDNFGITYKGQYKILNYTVRTRTYYTKSKYYSECINYWKMNDDKLMTLERTLSLFNSNSCYSDRYLNYVSAKMSYYNYAKTINLNYLLKLQHNGYLNKIKHENNLINVIKNEFGKDITIIIGNWSGCNLKNSAPTPCLHLKKILNEHFEVINIDEYLTSKTHYKYNVECSKTLIRCPPTPKYIENIKNKYNISDDNINVKNYYYLLHLKENDLDLETLQHKLKKESLTPQLLCNNNKLKLIENNNHIYNEQINANNKLMNNNIKKIKKNKKNNINKQKKLILNEINNTKLKNDILMSNKKDQKNEELLNKKKRLKEFKKRFKMYKTNLKFININKEKLLSDKLDIIGNEILSSDNKETKKEKIKEYKNLLNENNEQININILNKLNILKKPIQTICRTFKRRIHGLLTYKKVINGNTYSGIINRDYNACLNFERLFKNYIETGKRLEIMNRK